MAWLDDLRRRLGGQGGDGPPRAAGRVRGLPPSSNGASSLHLRWDIDPQLLDVAVNLTVIDAPQVERLYFWALQADFCDSRGRPAGGAHLGLQWHPRYPGSTAVNWGGYAAGGGELHGSASALPSALGNHNTRDYPWQADRGYRLTIAPAGTGPGEGPADAYPPGTLPDGLTAWRAAVTDLVTGATTVVRDLYVPGERISGAVVWSEVFARCDDPSVAVAWWDPAASTVGGGRIRPHRAGVNYQSQPDGGCANTNSSVGGGGLVQRTGCERTTPQGTVLPWPSVGAPG